jgi:hypothetical protein
LSKNSSTQSKLENSLRQELRALEQVSEMKEKELNRKYNERESQLEDAISREHNAYKQVMEKEKKELSRIHKLKVEQLERVSKSQEIQIENLQRLTTVRSSILLNVLFHNRGVSF